MFEKLFDCLYQDELGEKDALVQSFELELAKKMIKDA